jgi:hypothetical protein
MARQRGTSDACQRPSPGAPGIGEAVALNTKASAVQRSNKVSMWASVDGRENGNSPRGVPRLTRARRPGRTGPDGGTDISGGSDFIGRAVGRAGGESGKTGVDLGAVGWSHQLIARHVRKKLGIFFIGRVTPGIYLLPRVTS